ncbi:general stress protein [Flavobacterium enshiense DK69]|uniref:General stress protein n=1 Tax=Flavobacterium enshiense DK69 TaxID=1107311 RepID=V6S133_9FLAO|nr:bacillithiol system redox-active protein YtxJ [Flavobacterium enshiense]ESU20421.1 general stress protein [Flavobacterium enshiense DK69]KGO95774.1 general stress protein [Flavobacterium enshiense DK69]
MSFIKNIFGSVSDESPRLNMDWISLTDLEQLNEITELSHENPVVIFKHSTRCSISRMALKQFENEFDLKDKVTPYFLDLLKHREISNEIASMFGVVHQSPQMIIVKEGKTVYDASHSDIAAEDLKRFV